MFTLVGISTFYRIWTDSVIKNDDTVWIRQPNSDDALVRIKQLIKLNGLHNFANQFHLIFNDDFTSHFDCIILAVTDKWKLKNNHNNLFNYEKYSIHETPCIFLSNDKMIVNVDWIVQQCYIVSLSFKV